MLGEDMALTVPTSYPKERVMAAHTLQGEVQRLLGILSTLPGSKELHVKTRSYPRFSPGDAGSGYSERSWRMTALDVPTNIPIPPNSEDVQVTWQGDTAAQALGELREAISAALENMDRPISWDYEVHVHGRTSEEARRVEVQVYRRF